MRIPFLSLVAAILSAALCTAPALEAQSNIPDQLRTAAERTDYLETTRYDEALDFLEAVAEAAPHAHLATLGYSWEGRAIPLLVLGRVADASPESVRGSGLLPVYLQGTIHGGEVPGKEALLMLVRELATRPDHPWFQELVLLVAPIYNVDGNERVRLDNRPRQNGPLAGMGQRANAQGYDLNRDHMKLDSPEARSFAAMLDRYDPAVSVDLHTTNGTRHAYHLTYSPPLHPGTHPAITELLREDALPTITRRIRERDGWHVYYYGNAYERDGRAGWYTFDHRPRFNNNYLGLRNRIAILSEAYAYATFPDRVAATRRFVEEILAWSAASAGTIREVLAAAGGPVAGSRLPVRATFRASPEPVEIFLGAVEELRHPLTGARILNRVDSVAPTPMTEYGTFQGTAFETAPRAYLVPADAGVVLDRLAAHGVETTTLDADRDMQVEVFRVDSVGVAEREFQGHRERTVLGGWEEVERTVPAGTRVVALDQPLGRLAFYLLEPRSDDGLASWGLLGETLDRGRYPVWRVR